MDDHVDRGDVLPPVVAGEPPASGSPFPMVKNRRRIRPGKTPGSLRGMDERGSKNSPTEITALVNTDGVLIAASKKVLEVFSARGLGKIGERGIVLGPPDVESKIRRIEEISHGRGWIFIPPDDVLVSVAIQECRNFVEHEKELETLPRWMRVLERAAAYTWLESSTKLEMTLVLGTLSKKLRRIGKYVVVN